MANSRKPRPPSPQRPTARSVTGPATSAQKPSAFDKAIHDLRHQPHSAFPNVSPRWLLGASGVVLLAAVGCAWLALCLLYWQGSWQLLYHPKAEVVRTPMDLGVRFEAVNFATTETDKTQLSGWWIPAPGSAPRLTVLFLHGADGNLSDTIDTLAALRLQGLSIFAIDYRGYGHSQPLPAHGHPSEKQLRQDAEWSLTWLTVTRHVSPNQIMVYGSGLGAHVAAQLAADHGELAGLVLDQPLLDPMAAVFEDARSRLVPARWLVSDRYDLTKATGHMRLPSLWLMPRTAQPQQVPSSYAALSSRKAMVWLRSPSPADPHFGAELKRWIDEL